METNKQAITEFDSMYEFIPKYYHVNVGNEYEGDYWEWEEFDIESSKGNTIASIEDALIDLFEACDIDSEFVDFFDIVPLTDVADSCGNAAIEELTNKEYITVDHAIITGFGGFQPGNYNVGLTIAGELRLRKSNLRVRDSFM